MVIIESCKGIFKEAANGRAPISFSHSSLSEVHLGSRSFSGVPYPRQFVRRTTAVLMACGLIASLLTGFASAQVIDTEGPGYGGPGYAVTSNGLQIDGIQPNNPLNRVILDNDMFHEDPGWLILSAMHKLGRVDLRGIIVTHEPNQQSGWWLENHGPIKPFQIQIDDINRMRQLARDAGLYVMPHTEGARTTLPRPSSGNIDDTRYTSTPGSRLIIREALASTPDNPLLVFVGGQSTTVANALLEKPSIANNIIVIYAASFPRSYNTYDGWAAYVTVMRAPVVNLAESPWLDMQQYDGFGGMEPPVLAEWPNSALKNHIQSWSRIHRAYCDSPAIIWLFDQSLFTGANGQNITTVRFNSEGVGIINSVQVSSSSYGMLNIQRSDRRIHAIMRSWTTNLADPRVWDPDYSAKPVPNQSTNPIASAQTIDQTTRAARTARAGAIVPLDGPVLAGKPVTFKLSGNPGNPHWKLGDGATADGSSVTHTYREPGIYRVVMGSKAGDTFNELSSAIVRVHTPETVHLPQVLLDTDARNEVDDQHYIAYGLFSNLDVLGINSAHHGPHRINHFGAAQEPINYGEILYIIELSRISGLLEHRTENQIPRAFRGAKVPLEVPVSGKWSDTQPVKSEASEAILAAARGASPDNPVWVLPVGPCTNIASAILLAREEGLDLKSRIKIVWLGGGPERVNFRSHNGGSDPWSVFVTAQGDVDFRIILEHPTGASITMDKRVESGLYPGNRLGEYLEAITPAREKALFDVATISMVIGNHLGKHWLTLVEPSMVLGPDQEYRWKKVDSKTNVYIIREIDHEAMKKDFFDTLNGKPTALPPTRKKQ